MREPGIDLSGHRPKRVDEFTSQRFDYVIPVCDQAKDNCPVFMGAATRLHHSFADPTGPSVGSDQERMVIFRGVRDKRREYLKRFTASVGHLPKSL